MAYDEAVEVLNDYLEQDATLIALFTPKTLTVSPGYEPETIGDSPIYPYITFNFVNGFYPRTVAIHVDVVTYWVGEKDLIKLNKIYQRMLQLLNPDENHPDYFIADTYGVFKIKGVQWVGGGPMDLPQQENGIWQRRLSFAITYTK